MVYVGTFSKLLFPALRLGYLVVPPELIDAFTAARELVDRHPPTVEQAVLGYAAVDEARTRDGVRRLARVLE